MKRVRIFGTDSAVDSALEQAKSVLDCVGVIRTIDVVKLVINHAVSAEMSLADYLVDCGFVRLQHGIRGDVL
jgi:hypothetical protein